MNLNSSLMKRFVFGMFSLFLFGLIPALSAQAKPMSSSESMLRFFSEKPLGVVRVSSLHTIAKDIENLAQHVGFGLQVKMTKPRIFREMKNVLRLKKPIQGWSDAFQSLGLGADPALAIQIMPGPSRPPFVDVTVVLEVKDTKQLLQMVNQVLLPQRDKVRFQNCKYYQRMLQDLLIQSKRRNPKKTYTVQDLMRLRKLRLCKQVSFKVVKNKTVLSEDLAKGLAHFRQKFGLKLKSKSLGKLGSVYNLDGQIFALVQGRHLVWGSKQKVLRQALKKYSSSKGPSALAAGFRKNLSEQGRIQMFLDSEKYLALTMKYQGLFNQMARNSRRLRSPIPMKQLQRIAMSFGKGYDGIWLDTRVKDRRYSLHQIVTMKKKGSAILNKLIKTVKPTPLKSLAFLPKQTLAALSVNLIPTLFQAGKIVIKNLGNKALSKFAFQVDQWQKLLGNEITLALGSHSTSRIQGILMIEVKQPQQLSAMLTSMQAMLGAGGKSPIKNETYQNVPISYLFKSRGSKAQRGITRRAPLGEIAWAFVDKFFVVTYQLTNKPSLSLLKQMIDPKARRVNSILNNPSMKALLRRVQRTNFMAYISAPTLLQAIRNFVPPMLLRKREARMGLHILQTLGHLFAQGRYEEKKHRLSLTGEFEFKPASSPKRSPKKK